MPGKPRKPKSMWKEETFLGVEDVSRPARPPAGRGPSPAGKRPPAAGRKRPSPPGGGTSSGPGQAPRPAFSGGRPPSGNRASRPVSGGQNSGREVSRTGPERRTAGGPQDGRNKRSGANRQEQKRRPLKKRNPVIRAVKYGLLFLVLGVGTVLLCLFLLFKVATVTVTGDKIYSDDQIIAACNFQVGEALFFLPLEQKEKELAEQFPYIEKVKIRRKLPDGVEIEIAAAQVASCLESGGQWVYLNGKNEVLEQSASPREGTLQVKGLSVEQAEVGTVITVADSVAYGAYSDIVSAIAGLEGASGAFTQLDLSDIYNIRLTYQNRVVFELGGASSLDYKVKFGYSIVSDTTKIGAQEKGKLDLSVADDVKRANFTQDTGTTSKSASGSTASSGAASSSSSSTSGGVPDTPFTGETETAPETDGTDGTNGSDGTTEEEWVNTDDSTTDDTPTGDTGTGQTDTEDSQWETGDGNAE